MKRYIEILNQVQRTVETLGKTNQGTKAECDPDDSPTECHKEKLEDQLELEMIKKKLSEIKKSQGQDFTQVEDMEKESVEIEMMEYKKDFYDMSVGSLNAIMNHAKNILDSLDSINIKNNLTESWLQGKIAITEDYMRTIHDFVMFVDGFSDNSESSSKPGLWDNIRKKKEKEGKNYKPAKPGDKDRPDPKMWKKLTKDLDKDK